MSEFTDEDQAFLDDLLANPSTWAEPPAGLEDSVVAAVADAPGANVVPLQRKRRWTTAVSVAAVAAAIVVVVGLVAVRSDSNPEFQAQLSATELAPGASGSLDVTSNASGFRIELDASGLPTLPAGQFYQAWLRNEAGVLVPIGSFSGSDDKVTLWSGVDPKEFSTFSVTIEQADGKQESSGRRVLTGKLTSS
jgi:hypothetical protein